MRVIFKVLLKLETIRHDFIYSFFGGLEFVFG